MDTHSPSATHRIPVQKDSVVSWLLARLRNAALVLAVALALPGALGAQLAPPSTGGVTALDRILQRLAEQRRVLIVGAHPDDEDTSLLSLMSVWYGADAAYLSLSRGEGGQNLIGSELGAALGLVRSRELLAARGVDGTRQFFTRGFDFGYTRSVDEASIHWPPDSVLKDVVRIVRRFRPHVIVSVFSGTERDGHGQHQLAGVTALAAFEAAGDSSRFPELGTEEGLAPWVPVKLYRSTWFSPSETTLELETGLIDPREGRSIYQISMASRSKHRSQDMGRLQPIGPRQSRLRLLANRTAAADSDETDIFDGVPPTSTPLTRLADSLRGVLSTRNLADVSDALGAAMTDPGFDATEEQEALFRNARAIAGGVVIDAFTEDGELVPGQTVGVTLEVFNGGSGPFDLTAARIDAPAGWTVETDSAVARVVNPGELATIVYTMTVSADAKLTQPYFLERPRIGSLYDWSNTPAEIRGLGFQPPLLHASVDGRIGNAPAGLQREVTYRFNDQAVGEVRQEVRVVPLVDVKLVPERLVWPSGGDATYPFAVTLSYNGEGRYGGDVGVEIAGWPAPSRQRFSFSETDQSDTYVFEVSKPAGTDDV
jgi:LmbE family N-acetylglucosaminyl deacetylase